MNWSRTQDSWSPSESQMARGLHLFFTHVSPFVPFLHRPTFDTTQAAEYLVLGMLCLAYQYGEDPECGDQVGSGVSLSESCFEHARTAISSGEETMGNASTNKLSLIQAYLLLQIYAMFYVCGSESAYGLETHSKMIAFARAGGFMQPIRVESSDTKDLDSLWRKSITAESKKRTLFAAHQIDALWYQFLSIPRRLSHLEIKHDLPCPEEDWKAASAIDWAHGKLVATQSGSLLSYPDAVRCFLSPDTDFSTIPAFDPYGAINITHFIVSSAREISGWCTMTGLFSMERLVPLQTSMFALGSFIRAKVEISGVNHAALCEATWESAMVEAQLWSSTHTRGVVGGSMDTVLQQLTDLATSGDFMCEPDAAELIRPHIDWFLRYLDQPVVPDAEAPWVTLYAFKAFMIAWGFVSRGLGSMEFVGIQDGDTEGALVWAQICFGRRKRWQLGKIIMSILGRLRNSVTK
ncbi:hypothetical protein QQS21_001724 [Conoideocrella luteorostrata]|uniref:Xylanolytic transcriptional activator regulatory domain-containing protein n=1 Tax=Conoideocrella luteorostrata TaxID=1105319 RepID=A0AAJ0FY09_9HYPO|nr:hypothetical protein QQS21_001724 [Conoideocrella luteorostrata]